MNVHRPYHAILCDCDDPVAIEFPVGFDCIEANRSALEVADEIMRLLNQDAELETGDKIQDATFHTQIVLSQESLSPAILRFSNFGNLTTVINDDTVPGDVLNAILLSLAGHGYIYIPYREVLHEYDGKNKYFLNGCTWLGRYFDWV